MDNMTERYEIIGKITEEIEENNLLFEEDIKKALEHFPQFTLCQMIDGIVQDTIWNEKTKLKKAQKLAIGEVNCERVNTTANGSSFKSDEEYRRIIAEKTERKYNELGVGNREDEGLEQYI